jgi:hypothetical protein
VISYDALRLTRNWAKRPKDETIRSLKSIVQKEAWILEGGPTLLDHALHRCHGVVWLDPPELTRAWRLATRPWQNLGRVRAELPNGNVDWPLQQYAFAFNSLRKGSAFRQAIHARLKAEPPPQMWHCKTQRDVEGALDDVASSLQ